MSLVDRYAEQLVTDLDHGATLEEAIRDLTLSHAELLRELGSVRACALDPCPRCSGRLIAGEDEAVCAAGCGWRRAS